VSRHECSVGTSFSPRKWHWQPATLRSGALAKSLTAATRRTQRTFCPVALERTTGTGSRGPGQQHAISADLEGLCLAKGIVARAHIFALRLLHHQPRFRRLFYRLPRRMVEELKNSRSNDARHRTAVAAAACRRLPARRGQERDPPCHPAWWWHHSDRRGASRACVPAGRGRTAATARAGRTELGAVAAGPLRVARAFHVRRALRALASCFQGLGFGV
jgi:hypothetical protein